MAAPMRLIAQSDWEEVLREEDGKAWVTFCQTGHPKIHGELTCDGFSSDGNPYVSGTEGFNVHAISKKHMVLSYQNQSVSCRCTLQAPQITFTVIHPVKKNVLCVDVTPGGLGVSSDVTGKLKVWETRTGEVRRDLTGHVGDVYTCRFFPSGIVVLTGGADTLLKIWSAETGQCAATLKGHQQGVSDTAIIERGRNIISASRDGTVKLWDCGTATCLGTMSEINGGVVNGISLGVPDNAVELRAPDDVPDEREVLTEGKMVLVACENGSMQGYGVHSRKKIFGFQCSDAVNCCSFLSATTAVCGTQDGHICIFDLRNTSSPMKLWKESRAAILSFVPYKQGFFATTGDGSCFYVNEEYATSLELTGPDCDPVYKVAIDGSYAYTTCRDGAIRKYSLGNL